MRNKQKHGLEEYEQVCSNFSHSKVVSKLLSLLTKNGCVTR